MTKNNEQIQKIKFFLKRFKNSTLLSHSIMSRKIGKPDDISNLMLFLFLD
jgi:hypothetical protein